MANQQIMKLLQALGGGASESYGGGSGSFQRVGGQPLLPKPQISMPDALSPYAPGNQQGGPMASLGALTGGANDGSSPAPNSTSSVVHPKMRDSANHPAAQLAQYLATQEGRSPSARLKRTGTDPGAFIRGGHVVA